MSVSLRHTLLCFLTISPGTRLCEMYNLSGEDLKYKWEALNFRRPLWSQYNMDDVLELKARCKSDLEQATRSAAKVKGNLNGVMSRTSGTFFGRMGPRLGTAQTMSTPVKRRDGFAPTRGGGRGQTIAGPSKVEFTGPSGDEESSSARSCESHYRVKLGWHSTSDRSVHVREGV